jgi:hypothetical protein
MGNRLYGKDLITACQLMIIDRRDLFLLLLTFHHVAINDFMQLLQRVCKMSVLFSSILRGRSCRV